MYKLYIHLFNINIATTLGYLPTIALTVALATTVLLAPPRLDNTDNFTQH